MRTDGSITGHDGTTAGQGEVGEHFISVIWLGCLVASIAVWNPMGYLSFQPAKALVAWIAVVGLCVVATSARRNRSVPLVPVAVLACFFIAILASFFANDISWVRVVGWAPRAMGLFQWALLSAFFLAGIWSGRSWRRLLPLIDWLSIGAGFIGLAQMSGLEVVQGGAASERVGTYFGSATSAGAFAAFTMPLIVDGIFRHDGRRRALVRRWAAVIAASAVLIGSGSRTGLIAAVAGVAVVAMVNRSRQTRRASRFVLAVGLLTLLLFSVVNSERLRGIADESSTANGRVELWRAGIEGSFDRPVLGSGPESTRSVLPRFLNETFEATFGDAVIEDRAHNALIDITLVSGIVGLATFIALAGVVGIGAYRGRRLPGCAGVAGVLVAYAIHLSTNFVATEPDTIAWFFAGVAAQSALVAPRLIANRRIRVKAAVAIPVALLAIAGGVLSARLLVADSLIRTGVDTPSNEPEIALAKFQRATTWGPEQPYLWELLARAEWRAGLLGDAAKSAATSIRVGGSDGALLELAAEIQLDQAMTSGSRESLESVAEQYLRLVDLSPTDGSLRSGYGAALAASGELDGALVQLRLATEISPRNLTAWTRRSVVEDALGLCEDSRMSMNVARQLPGFVEVSGAPICDP